MLLLILDHPLAVLVSRDDGQLKQASRFGLDFAPPIAIEDSPPANSERCSPERLSVSDYPLGHAGGRQHSSYFVSHAENPPIGQAAIVLYLSRQLVLCTDAIQDERSRAPSMHCGGFPRPAHTTH